MFQFRPDNREKVIEAHVKRLIQSIKTNNLLHCRPIVVNQKMEIIDGQHRLLAAKALDTEIYYQVIDLSSDDIVRMNIAKTWSNSDFVNFYCRNGYEEYIKLNEFMKKHNLNLKVAMNIAMGTEKKGFLDFKLGKFKFDTASLNEELDVCWDTINYIKKMNGFSTYTSSSRFWHGLLKLVSHPGFDKTKWRFNIERMIDHFGPRARTQDYQKMLMDIYNWKNTKKIDLTEADAEVETEIEQEECAQV